MAFVFGWNRNLLHFDRVPCALMNFRANQHLTTFRPIAVAGRAILFKTLASLPQVFP
jgi:hypothetical protein